MATETSPSPPALDTCDSRRWTSVSYSLMGVPGGEPRLESDVTIEYNFRPHRSKGRETARTLRRSMRRRRRLCADDVLDAGALRARSISKLYFGPLGEILATDVLHVEEHSPVGILRVITVTVYRIDRTTTCGRTGKQLQ